jgi:hypothetical protein
MFHEQNKIETLFNGSLGHHPNKIRVSFLYLTWLVIVNITRDVNSSNLIKVKLTRFLNNANVVHIVVNTFKTPIVKH